MTETPKAAPGFTHTATLYAEIHDVPVRRDGAYWWSQYVVNLGIVHSARNVTNLREI